MLQCSHSRFIAVTDNLVYVSLNLVKSYIDYIFVVLTYQLNYLLIRSSKYDNPIHPLSLKKGLKYRLWQSLVVYGILHNEALS